MNSSKKLWIARDKWLIAWDKVWIGREMWWIAKDDSMISWLAWDETFFARDRWWIAREIWWIAADNWTTARVPLTPFTHFPFSSCGLRCDYGLVRASGVPRHCVWHPHTPANRERVDREPLKVFWNLFIVMQLLLVNPSISRQSISVRWLLLSLSLSLSSWTLLALV